MLAVLVSFLLLDDAHFSHCAFLGRALLVVLLTERLSYCLHVARLVLVAGKCVNAAVWAFNLKTVPRLVYT